MSIDLSGNYHNDPLMQAVSLSIDVNHFLTQDKVGRYLFSKAMAMREAALEELAVTEPTNIERIRELQMAARIPELFQEWLNEAMAAGISAEETIALEERMSR